MDLRLILPYGLLTAAIAGTLGVAWLIEPDAVPVAAVGLIVGTALGYCFTRA